MSGLITIFQTIFYVLALCFCIGTFIWLIKDVKLYRKEVEHIASKSKHELLAIKIMSDEMCIGQTEKVLDNFYYVKFLQKELAEARKQFKKSAFKITKSFIKHHKRIMNTK